MSEDVSRYYDESGVVVLVDPNKVNTNVDMTNAIPNYEDMHIYARLTAKRRGRTIIMTSATSSVVETKGDGELNVNLMGANEKGMFTTKWHDIDGGDSGQLETFGITRIGIKTNTSFIPQIEIEFTDIRGYSFFDNKNSPYRIIFDFPPPLFTLDVKGYYGKSLKYLLHLVKYTSNFNSDTGNFVINGEFVGITYAPLSDILFRYAINFPLIPQKQGTENPDASNTPQNTFDFLLKLEALYHYIDIFKNTTPTVRSYDNAVNNLDKYIRTKERLKFLVSPDSPFRVVDSVGEPNLFIQGKQEPPPFTTIEKGETRKISNFNEYDNYLESFSGEIPDTPFERLLLGFVGKTTTPFTTEQIQQVRIKTIIENRFKTILNDIFGTHTIASINIDFNPNILQYENKDYIVFDLTTFYVEFFRKKNEFNDLKTKYADELNNEINKLIQSELGMVPTIYNVFKLLMDDVDTFFTILRDTSLNAEEKHNRELLGKITNTDLMPDFTTDKLYSFPLIIKNQPIRGGCGGERQVRWSPAELGKANSYSFPELELVDNFIETFVIQNKERKLFSQRRELGTDGQYLWIPLSPLDSRLLSGAASPYFGINRTSEPINTIYRRILQRYYILTQNIYGLSFKKNKYDGPFLELYSNSEASNLLEATMNNDKILLLLKEHSRSFKDNSDAFYEYIRENDLDINTNTDVLYLSGDNRDEVYKTKKNKEFSSFTIYLGDITSYSKIESGPLYDFLEKYHGDNFWNRIRSFLSVSELVNKQFNFNPKNLIILKDEDDLESSKYLFDYKKNNSIIRGLSSRNDSTDSILFGSFRIGAGTPGLRNQLGRRNRYVEYVDFLDDIKKTGNLTISNIGGEERDSSSIKISGIDNVFSRVLNGNFREKINKQYKKNDYDLYNKLINTNNPEYNEVLSNLFILSAFGNVLSPFTNQYNESFFSKPMICELPQTVVCYLGCIAYIIDNNLVDSVYEFLLSDLGIKLTQSESTLSAILNDFTTNQYSTYNANGGVRIVSDIIDVKNHLSIKDRNDLKDYYNRMVLDDSSDYKNRVFPIFKVVVENDLFFDFTRLRGTTALGDNMVPDSQAEIILNFFMERINLLIHSEKSFYAGERIDENENYIRISELGDEKKQQTDNHFKKFFNRIFEYVEDKEKDDKEKEESERNKQIYDEDIRTQTYYSLKNINDKWLSGVDAIFGNTNISGYPFNQIEDENGEKKLINSFAFVDRTMSPIGDTIINPELLLDIINNPDTSIFTAISQILSVNGFEFFPLQNFMVHERTSWVDSFKIDVNGSAKFKPVFVCMYIGGSSNYLETGGEFKNDGITDLLNPGVGDFTLKDCDEVIENDEKYDNQTKTNPKFPWREVRAFRVRFGEQDQSMFHDIKIEGNEFPETNESIQILSRIAGDNKLQAPIPKGQNLYNLYENRAYSSTITSLGNMMIQPSQYYQLENIPLFNGAYIILNVEHEFKPNHATTKFEGTKILKYPVPRVQQPHASFGFEGGTLKIGDIEDTDLTPGTPIELTEDERLNPPITPLLVRRDDGGWGDWGARRRGRIHRGIDFVALPGDQIFAPFMGRVINFKGANSSLPMLRITPNEPNKYFDYLEILYINPPRNISFGSPERNVNVGGVIGIAANLRNLGYTERVGNHIHVQMFKNGNRINPTGFFNNPPTQTA